MSSKKDSHWIPLADLMTFLMVNFCLCLYHYTFLIKKKLKDQNQNFKVYEKSKLALYNVLNNAFNGDFSKWILNLTATCLSNLQTRKRCLEFEALK